MSIKISSAVALLALAAAPLTGQAADSASNAAFDACIKAFTATYLPKHTVRDTKKTDAFETSPILQYWKPTSYTIELRARGVNSGDTYAAARCLVDRDGVVLVEDASQKGIVTVQEPAAL